MEEAVNLLESLGVRTDIVDKREAGAPIQARFRGSLTWEQRQAAKAMLARDLGVLAAATGFGKTVVAAHLIAERGVGALVLVHRKQLLEQWLARLAEFLDLGGGAVGQIGAGRRRPSGIVDVATIQSFGGQRKISDAVGLYGHLIVDECHRLPAPGFEKVAGACGAKYVAGLTATPERRDGLHPVLFMQCGPIRHRVDERRRTAAPPPARRLIVRKTSFRAEGGENGGAGPHIQKLFSMLAADEERNALIVADALEAAGAGRSPLVLTERKVHVALLAERLSAGGFQVVALEGGMGAKRRREAFERLAGVPESEPRIIVATGRFLGEGFDDARLDALFLAFPVSWRGTLAQYAGRLHRSREGKADVRIYDYADFEVPVLARMHERRMRGYRSLGYRVEEREGELPL